MPNRLQQTNTAADMQSPFITTVAALMPGAALALGSAQVTANDLPGTGPPAWRGDLAPLGFQRIVSLIDAGLPTQLFYNNTG